MLLLLTPLSGQNLAEGGSCSWHLQGYELPWLLIFRLELHQDALSSLADRIASVFAVSLALFYVRLRANPLNDTIDLTVLKQHKHFQVIHPIWFVTKSL